MMVCWLAKHLTQNVGCMCGVLTRRGQVNDEAIANIHCPVLIGAPEDLYQVPRLWFHVVLGVEHTDAKVCLYQTPGLSVHVT